MHALFNGQVQLALGVVQLTLLFDQLGLGLLGLKQLGVAHLEHVLQLCQFAGFGFQLVGRCGLGLLASSAATRVRSVLSWLAT
ncbi:hypothetical protein LP416_11415 [Polaromonas sp. P2-4]|nr:hypothetical protein LP416_11415 [Polaromonas sp. P2-4]